MIVLNLTDVAYANNWIGVIKKYGSVHIDILLDDKQELKLWRTWLKGSYGLPYGEFLDRMGLIRSHNASNT